MVEAAERREQRRAEKATAKRKRVVATAPRRQPKVISPATPEQREIVRGRACIVCGRQPCHPSHLIDRSSAPSAGDDPRAVVPLCPTHHREYDEGPLDLSPFLEPYYRESIAWAVEAVGLFLALRRITKSGWMAVPRHLEAA